MKARKSIGVAYDLGPNADILLVPVTFAHSKPK